MFRMSRTRFKVLTDDMKVAQIGFYKKAKNLHVEDQVSFEAQLLLPIKTLAYGVPPHTSKLPDFQMLHKILLPSL
jgi:hypothetical protein